MEVFESLRDSVVGKNVRIVLPEGQEPRILQAVKRIVKESVFTWRSKILRKAMKS